MSDNLSRQSRLIVTVHGIRTFGQWQERLERQVSLAARPDEDIHFVNYKYGYFSVIAFLIPFFRWLVVRRFRSELLLLYQRHAWDRIDLVAHSFGTHVVAWGIAGIPKEANVRFHTVILAGSVLRSGFPWGDLLGVRIKRLVNDCGTKDSILLLSQFFVLFTGMAGRTGFGGATSSIFRNRYFALGHSGYFLADDGASRDDFMEVYWLPLLLGDEGISGFDSRTSSALEGLVTVLSNNAEPIKILFYVTPFVLLSWFVYGLYIEAVEQRQRSERAFQQASRSSAELVGELAQEFRSVRGVPESLITGILRKSEGLVESLSLEDPQNRQMQRSLGVALAELSSRYLAQENLGQSQEAAARALKIFERLYQNSPYHDEAADLIAAQDRAGDAALRIGERARAQKMYDEELSLATKLLRQDPQSPKVRELLAVALEKVALISVKSDAAKALSLHKESLAIREALLREAPGSSSIMSAVATSELNIADMLATGGDSDEALEHCSRALKISLSLLEAHPNNTEFIMGAAVAEQKLGDFYRDRKDFAESLSHYRHDLEIMAKLMDSDPANIGWRRDIQKSYFRVGDAYLSMKENEPALRTFREGLDVAKQLAKDNPDRADWRSLSAFYQRICGTLAATGEFDRALSSANEGVIEFEGIADKLPAEVPRLTRMVNNAAWNAILARKYDAARTLADRAIGMDPVLIEARINKIDILALTAGSITAKQYYNELKQLFDAATLEKLVRADAEQLQALGFGSGEAQEIRTVVE